MVGTTNLFHGDLQLFGARLRLQTLDGVAWRLYCSPLGYKLVGRKVELKGKRVGFDELDVEWITEVNVSRASAQCE